MSAERRQRQLLPGTRVGDHLVVRSVLGEGGTATVYEALHTRLAAPVALKVLDNEVLPLDDSRARLRREAHVCASIEDPHVPEIYDVGALPDGTPYVVMERVTGPTLESLLQGRPLPPALALNIARDLLCALSAIHGVGVVHRDIKPGNLIVQIGADDSVRVRLMDFGLSKRLIVSEHNPLITRPGTAVGTPHYMAPEQISGRSVDGRADVYAAGVLLYEMLTGRKPFDGESIAAVISAVLVHEYVPLSQLVFVPSWLESVVERAMAAQPEDRYASAALMREALDARDTQPPSGARSSVHPHGISDDLLFRRVVAAGSGAALMFGVLVWVYVMQRTSAPAAPPELPSIVASRAGSAPGASAVVAAPALAPGGAEPPALSPPAGAHEDTPELVPAPPSATLEPDHAMTNVLVPGTLPDAAPRPRMEGAEPPPRVSDLLPPDPNGAPRPEEDAGADAGGASEELVPEAPSAAEDEHGDEAQDAVPLPGNPFGSGLPDNPY